MSKQEKMKNWRELPKGTVSYKSAEEYKTGDWGVYKPIINHQKCTKCTLCHFYCPEGAIKVLANGDMEINLEQCKGCGICAEECPVHCIKMVGTR